MSYCLLILKKSFAILAHHLETKTLDTQAIIIYAYTIILK
jgi:hypothetical protein